MTALVFGSINMDVVARVQRMPAPGETLSGQTLNYFPGGKGANQAVALARAGTPTRMVGCLGTDAFADELLDFLNQEGLDVAQVGRVQDATGTALILVDDGGENSIVVIPGANARLTPEHVQAVDLNQCKIAVSQFEIPGETIEAAFNRCRRAGVTTLLNPAPVNADLGGTLALADILVVNEVELGGFSGQPVADTASVEEITAAANALCASPHQRVVVTLGARGVVAVAEDGVIQLPGRSVDVVDTTGAGDCFTGYLAAGLATDMSLADALGRANLAASVCVSRAGAAPSIPRQEEVNKLR